MNARQRVRAGDALLAEAGIHEAISTFRRYAWTLIALAYLRNAAVVCAVVWLIVAAVTR